MSELTEIEGYLDYLAHRLMAEQKRGRVSRSTYIRIADLARRVMHIPNVSREVHQYAMVLREAALHPRRPEQIYDLLHHLRNTFRETVFREASMFTQRQVRELQAEVEELRKQLQAEQPEEPEEIIDEHEDAVKKFKASKNRVFVIMPFSPDFDDVWKGGIERACAENGFASLRVDQVSLSSWITDDVEDFVKMSTTVIADVTGSNPNVMFELGYALAEGKDPIIICQPTDSDKIPFDIAGIRHITYEDSWKGIEQLAKELKKYLLTTRSKQKERRIRKKTTKK